MASRLRALSNKNPYSIWASSPHCRASRSMASIRSPARRPASVPLPEPGQLAERRDPVPSPPGIIRPQRPGGSAEWKKASSSSAARHCPARARVHTCRGLPGSAARPANAAAVSAADAASCSRQRPAAARLGGRGIDCRMQKLLRTSRAGRGIVIPGVATAMSQRTFRVSPSPAKSRGPRIF